MMKGGPLSTHATRTSRATGETPPWTVLSPAEKGGRLGVGLAPLSRKKKLRCYRNTNDKSTNSTSSGRRRASLVREHRVIGSTRSIVIIGQSLSS